MASAPTLPFVPVDEYLKKSYEPGCEYLDGVLLPKAEPDYVHSALQRLSILYLGAQQVKFRHLKGLGELHMRVTPTRFRIPDVAGMIGIPSDGRYPDRQTPPLFTIEIVSLEEPLHALKGKVADHVSMGVSVVILADPYDRTVMVATQSEPLHAISPPLAVDIPFPGGDVLRLDFDDLYRKLDQELE